MLIKVVFTDGTGDSVPSIPSQLGTEVSANWESDKYHWAVIIETNDAEKCIDWFDEYFSNADVSEGVLYWSKVAAE